MAVKEKKAKKSKVLEVLRTEYKWENVVLAILASLALAFSLMIINGALVVRESFPLIGQYPKVFAWILFSISVIGILLVVYPFLVQAFPELKKISWANFKTAADAVVKVFIFVILFALLFVGFDAMIAPIIKLLSW